MTGRIGKTDRVLSASPTEPVVSAHSGNAPLRGFAINIRWGHIDRMPRCEHGRVVCSCFDGLHD